MIISSRKARSICANHAVVKVVPELLAAVEAVVRAQNIHSRKSTCCGGSKESTAFAEAEQTCLKAIRGLSKEAIGKLKTFLNETELYIYETSPGEKPRMIEL